MKHHVFFLLLLCSSVSYAMENSEIVARALERYVSRLEPLNPYIDYVTLAGYIAGVRQSDMTYKQRNKALGLIWDQERQLDRIMRQGHNRQEQRNWVNLNEPSEKRRKIN